MICNNCKQEISDDSLYCQYCGTQVQTIIKNEYIKNKKQNRLIYIALAIFLGLGAIYNTILLQRDSTQLNTIESTIDLQVNEYTALERISNATKESLVTKLNDSIYYINNNNQLIKTDEQFSQQEIIDSNVSLITSNDTTLFYRGNTLNIYEYDLETGESKEIVNDLSYYIYATNDALYYQNDRDQESLYRYDLNTKEKTRLVQEPVYSLYVDDTKVWYCTKDTISYYDLVTNESTTVLEQSVTQFVHDGNAIYYLSSSDNLLYAYNITTEETICLIDEGANNFVMNEKYIIVNTLEEYDNTIGIYDMSSNEYYYYDLYSHSYAIVDHYLIFISDNNTQCILDLDTDLYTELPELATSTQYF